MAGIAIVMGSKSDGSRLQSLFDILKEFGVPFVVKVLSAHRTPDELVRFVKEAPSQGISLIIAAAGGAAHLPGVIASHTRLPVIGIPIANPPHQGLDAMFSILEMPGGVPVVGVGAGAGGPANAALFAMRILALNDPDVERKYDRYVAEMRRKALKGSESS